MVRRRQHLSPAAIAKREEGYGDKKGNAGIKERERGGRWMVGRHGRKREKTERSVGDNDNKD